MNEKRNDYGIYDLEGYLITIKKDLILTELAEFLDCDYTGVGNHLKGHLLSVGRKYQIKVPFKGKMTKRIGDVSEAVLTTNTTKKVSKYYNGEFITTYNSLDEASRLNNLDITTISRCIMGERRKAGIYTFKFSG